MKNKGLYKTIKFKNPKYIGDPINAVKIFNDKEVDELLLIDIDASKENRPPDFDYISKITREAFMPVGYGGGVTTIEQFKKLFFLGVEKVAVNCAAIENMNLISEASALFGSQSVVLAVDIKKNHFGKYFVYNHKLKSNTKLDPIEYIQEAVKKGAGEILVNSVDRDGTYLGYDIEYLKRITSVVDVPVIGLGGAGKIEDFVKAVKEANLSAVSAGSLFVFHGPHKAVLITYPNKKELRRLLQ
jgi:cyclase